MAIDKFIYPGISKKIKQPKIKPLSETQIQQACVKWFYLQYPQYASMLLSVPNGGFRNVREAIKLKREGQTNGVSDLILLVGKGDYHSLCIEMKSKIGVLSQCQKEWQIEALKHLNRYVIVRSLDEFMKIINDYMKCKNT
jgi:hypothetical protein